MTSAGLSPAEAVNPAIAASVAELGLNIGDRVPRALTADDLDRADVVVLMRTGLRLPSEPSGTVLGWEFPDPTAWNVEAVRPLRKSVAARIEQELLAR